MTSLAVVLEHFDVRAQRERRRCRRIARAGDGHAHPESLRRAEGVHQEHAGVVCQQALLDRLAPHRSGRDHHGERAQVPVTGLRIERGQQRSGEGIADDDEAVHVLAFHRIEQLDRVVPAALEQCDLPSLGKCGVGGEPPGPVHQRARRHQGERARCFEERLAHPVDPAVDRVLADAPGDEAGEEVILAPHDALGHARRPARVDHDEVVATASPRGGDACRGCTSRRGGFGIGRGPVGAGPGGIVDPEPRRARWAPDRECARSVR